MPKKTKKAKLLAEYRRKLQRLSGAQTQTSPDTHHIPTHEVFTLPTTTLHTQEKSLVLLPEVESQAIKKDLTKTLIIVSFFMIFEFVLANLL